MAEINLGFNFTNDTVKSIKEYNRSSKSVNRITSVYGSDKEHHHLSARPLYRFPDNATLDNLISYAAKLKEIGVRFWYTSNAISVGPKKDFDFGELENLTYQLSHAGIGMIVADTLLLELISKCAYKPRVELSTIMRLESPRQMIALKEQYPFIEKMVMHISYNRSFYLLKQFVKAGNHCGVTIELLTNEACGTGYSQGATPCIHRDSCYKCHGSNVTLQDAKEFKQYPFNKCIGERYKSQSSWLNLFWILPEQFKCYEAIGINNFKLTGRTASQHFIDFILPKYVNGKFDGNLLHIWKSIESINGKVAELPSNLDVIDTNKLKNFLAPFVDGEIECHSRLCGIDCNYCEMFYAYII